ncbi:hypothetical protein PsorP6_013046 [Peronosclerospora sorghi]|uniref:Uncharacterized protein n=1 Tax=Peronosclerospora sorghi TaxID=230839 RepID=A0ACC0WH76_9STRA|nr:hypothetical protein PsorP6_013046 [Peronosclerospora sorghi]
MCIAMIVPFTNVVCYSNSLDECTVGLGCKIGTPNGASHNFVCLPHHLKSGAKLRPGTEAMAEFRQAKHTIILVQYTRDPNSRTYLDFESVNGGMDGVVKMYEAKLKQLNPNLKNITYDIQDLYTYIDSLTDLSALVLDLETKTYLPCGKEWIKKKVFQVLKNQAG